LSQYTRVTDRRTDRRTDRILIAIPRLHYMQRGKNWHRCNFIASTYLKHFSRFVLSVLLMFGHFKCMNINGFGVQLAM